MKPGLRDEVVDFIGHWHARSELPLSYLAGRCGLGRSRYYEWRRRRSQPNEHNAAVPRSHWLLPWEKQAIIDTFHKFPDTGYRRLTYLMLDEDIVAASPSTTYRVLKGAGLLEPRANPPSRKGNGFVQPLGVHEHWHTDFAHLKLGTKFYFMASVLDGCSRAILSWHISETMTVADAEIAVQKAREAHPGAKPRLISDNGPQFIAKEFKQFIGHCEMTHVRTSPYYPQSNGKLERYHRSIKQECIRLMTPLTLEDALRVVSGYVDNYNTNRYHSAIGYITPTDRLEGRHKAIFRERKRKYAQARENRQSAYGGNLAA